MLLALSVPLALHVTHGLSGSGFGDPRSRAAWADAQLARLPAAGGGAAPLSTLVSGLPRTRVASAWAQAAAAVGAPRSGADIVALPGHPHDVLVDVLPATRAGAAAATRLGQQLSGLQGVTVRAVNLGTAGGDVLGSAMTTLRRAAYIALPILAILLLLVYDSAVAALLPLIVALVGAVLALAAIDLLEPYMRLSVYLTNIVSFLALGVGVDYSLFLSSRFRAALRREIAAPAGATAPRGTGTAAAAAGGARRSRDRPAVVAALSEATRTAGRSVFFSALAVGTSMLALLVPRTAYWSGLAVGGCVAVLAVLLTTLTLLPALLAMLGTQSERGRLPRPPLAARVWPGLAAAVTRRPVWVLLGGIVVLVIPALAAPAIAVRTPADVATMLAPHAVQRLAVEQQQKDYGPGSIAPLPVVLISPHPLASVATWVVVGKLTRRLAKLPGAERVASPTSSGLPATALAAAFATPGRRPAALAAATAPPGLIALSVTSRYGPDDARTVTLLHQLQRLTAQLPPGWRGGVGGPIAELASFNALVAHTLPLMVAAVAGVALVVLFAASGSLWVALLAVLFDALVALSTAGVLVFFVQQGRAGFQALPLDASITPLIFVVLFGLSMDYEVILIHRIREYAAGGATAAEAARRGLGETGGMITGAGLLMVVAFGALLVSPLQLMRTMALGMGAAILLDTWVVRTCLVPTSMALIGRSVWWPFGLSAAHPRGDGAGATPAAP